MTHLEYIAAQDRLCRWGIRCYHAGRWLVYGAIVVSTFWFWVGLVMVFAGMTLLHTWGWSYRQSFALTKRRLESL